jgi:hypothetical protein
MNAGDKTAPSGRAVVRCSIVCPLCKTTGSQFRLNPGMFWYGAREVDLQPSDYHCRQGMEGVYPPLFAMWHCAACCFTAEQAHFLAPLEGVLIRLDTVASRINAARQNDACFGAVTARLSESVDASNPTMLQGVKLHLLAIWIWEFIGKMVRQDYMTQARYCLFLAWLHRDMKALDNRPEQTAEGLAGLAAALQPFWPDFPADETAALRSALAYYEATLAISNFSKDPVNETTVMQRIGRIQIKLREFDRAYEMLRRTLFATRRAAAEVARDSSSGDAADKPAGAEQKRRLATVAEECERLMEIVRESKRG